MNVTLQNYLSNWRGSERVYYWAAIGILCLGLGMSLKGLDKGIWLDEYSSLRQILSQDFLSQLRSYNHPPLYFILLKFWSKISMREEFLRLLSVVFGIGTIAVVMKWIKQYSRLGSLLAGLYCATLPLMLRYSQEIRGYSLLLFATALSFFFAFRLITEPEKLSGYVGLAVSSTVAVATHAVGVMLLTSTCLYVAITPSAWKMICLKRAILAISVPVCVFILLFFFFLQGAWIDNWWMPAISLRLIVSTAQNVLGFGQPCHLSQVMQHPLPVLANCTPALVTVVIICGTGVSLFGIGNWKRSLPLLAAAVCYWAELVIYSIFVLPIFWYRTVLPGMIPFIGFLGLQISITRMKKLKVLLVAGLTLLCAGFAVHWIAHTPSSHWREMSQLLQSTWQPNDIVIVFPSYIEEPLLYNVDLPSKAILPVQLKANMNEVEEEIGKQVAQLSGETKPFSVLLVVRFDKRVEKHLETHDRLLRFLEVEFGQPSYHKKLKLLSLSKYELHANE